MFNPLALDAKGHEYRRQTKEIHGRVWGLRRAIAPDRFRASLAWHSAGAVTQSARRLVP